MARDARIYIYHVAGKLDVQVKGAGLSDGIEIFPKQDELRPDEFGNAIRAPLGIHRGAREGRGWRYCLRKPRRCIEVKLLLLFLGRVLFPDTGLPQGLHSSCSACQSPALPYRFP